MIVIVDDNTERGLALRHSALSAFLPCAFCSVSEFVHVPHGKDIVVLCADREDQLSALGSADKAELIVINHTGKNIINTDAYFYSEENDGDLVQFLKARAAALCGNDADTPSYGGIYFNPEGKVVFCGRKFALTRLERTIVLLLIFGMREWYTAEDMVRNCFVKVMPEIRSNTVSVHVSNINSKSRRVCGKKLILTRRFGGYRLNPLFLEHERFRRRLPVKAQYV